MLKPFTGKRARGEQASKQQQQRQLQQEEQRQRCSGSKNEHHPVACDACGEEVGVFDVAEELYHFLTAFPSNA